MFCSSSDLWPLRDQKYVLEALIFWLSERKEKNKHLAVSWESRNKNILVLINPLREAASVLLRIYSRIFQSRFLYFI